MKNAFFLALFLFACREGEDKVIKKQCFKMVISDAIPIQFWVDGCETFNQKDIKGINKACFCQPFECDDNIRVQLTDTANQLYFLSFNDSSDVLLKTIQFTETSTNQNIIDAHFTTDLDGLNQSGLGDPTRLNPWAWESNDGGRLQTTVSQIGSDITNTEIVKKTVIGLQGNNTVTAKWGIGYSTVIENISKLQLYLIRAGIIMQTIDVDMKSGPTGSVSTDFVNTITDLSFVASTNYDQIGMGIVFESSSGLSAPAVYLYNFHVESIKPSVYNAQFSFEDLGICDKQVSLTISAGGGFNAVYETPISGWSNISGAGPDWTSTTNGFQVIVSSSTPSDALHIPINIPFAGAVNVDFEIDGNLAAGVSHATIGFYKSGVLVSNIQTINTQFFTNTGTVSFVLTDSADEIRVVESLIFALAYPITYLLKDSLKVYSGGTVKAYSDCIDVRTSWDETILINYSNARNFAGIDSQDVSPGIEFNLRILAIFFEEEFPQEQEVMELSDNQEISLNSQIKVQQLLNTGQMPFYMHKKTILALMHQSVLIDGKFWVKADPYEKIPGNKRNPLKQYKCLLTQQDDIIRNIL